MVRKKKTKTQVKSERYYDLYNDFHEAYVKCIRAGICISPECIVNNQKWRIVIEDRDEEGGVKSRKESDPNFYYSKEELDEKVMELYIFYSRKV